MKKPKCSLRRNWIRIKFDFVFFITLNKCSRILAFRKNGIFKKFIFFKYLEKMRVIIVYPLCKGINPKNLLKLNVTSFRKETHIFNSYKISHFNFQSKINLGFQQRSNSNWQKNHFKQEDTKTPCLLYTNGIPLPQKFKVTSAVLLFACLVIIFWFYTDHQFRTSVPFKLVHSFLPKKTYIITVVNTRTPIKPAS